MAAREEEATDQEEVCADLRRRDGTVVDEADDLRMDLQCKASRQWVEERLLRDTTTATSTTKGHRPVNSHHMAEDHRLVRGHRCRLDKPSKWTTAQARLQQTSGLEKATVMLQACSLSSKVVSLLVRHRDGHRMAS